MKATDRRLRELLYSGDQYVVPVFQRYYKWEKEDWGKLWDDIDALYTENSGKSHFMGSLVCMAAEHVPGVVPSYLLIDGQQRIVTLSLLLSAIRDIAKERNDNKLAEEIQDQFLVHKYKQDSERYKVFVRLRDRNVYNSIIDENLDSLNDFESGILSSYDYFKIKIKGEREDGTHYDLRTLFTTVSDRLGFVLITLEGDPPFKIFKSLNSTGAPLEESDLIRNYMFTRVGLNEAEEFDREYWTPIETLFTKDETVDGKELSDFIRDFLISQGGYVRVDEIADSFERAFPSDQIDPKILAEELKKSAILYSIVTGKASHEDSRIEMALHGLRNLDAGTSYPLVLKLLRMNSMDQLARDDLITTLNCLRGFILRRYICDYGSRAYGKWFASAIKELSNGHRSLLSYLDEKGWPDDSEFHDTLLKFNLFQSNYGQVLLASIEDSIGNGAAVDPKKTTIEHVMPQSLTDEWKAMLGSDFENVHKAWKDTIGNLTLAGYNGDLGNRPFDEKKKLYSQSGFKMNRYFSDKNAWTSAEIEARGKELARVAAKIFPYAPQIPAN